MKIEEGKLYVSRKGETVGPIQVTTYDDGRSNSYWPFTIGMVRFWRDDGTAYNTARINWTGDKLPDLYDPNDDLVAEASAEALSQRTEEAGE